MNSNIIVLIFLGLLISGCSVNEMTLEDELNNIKLPEIYSINQIAFDTGYAGVPDTGEYSYNFTFDIENEKILSDTESEFEQFTMSDIKLKINELNFENKGIKIEKDKICFLHEQGGISVAFVCFKENMPYYFHLRETKGNHQSNEFIWTLTNVPFQTNEYCKDSGNLFCNVFYNALNIEDTTCNEVPVSKEYCESILLD